MTAPARVDDDQLLDAVEDLSRLSDRQLLERLCRAAARTEHRLGQVEDRLSPPDQLAMHDPTRRSTA